MAGALGCKPVIIKYSPAGILDRRVFVDFTTKTVLTAPKNTNAPNSRQRLLHPFIRSASGIFNLERCVGSPVGDLIDDLCGTWIIQARLLRVMTRRLGDNQKACSHWESPVPQNKTFGSKDFIKKVVLPLRQWLDIRDVHLTRLKEALV